ncbi:MAG TPA: hypothetical protein VMQ81_11120 [Acidimicrobiia bacterium]|nr:hypothetical protein [Acidimicrobiia bacterium]
MGDQPAWLGRPPGEWPDGSPRAGQVFWVHTDILGRRDAHSDAYRPAVVISVNTEVGRVFVMTRTTNPKARGVTHGRVPAVGLDKDATFDPSWYQGVELSMFTHPFVEFIFDLAVDDPATWAEVIAAMEAS